jgi:hypothetical protein
MKNRVLIEEFHLSFFVPRGLPDPEVQEARRVLKAATFRRKLSAAVTAVCRRMPKLRRASLRVSW